MWFLTLLWLAAAAFAPLDGYQLSAAFALLVAFPVALSIDTSVPRWLTYAAWGLGPLAAASLLLERGLPAAALASTWMLVALAHLVHGGIRFVNSARYDSPAPWGEAAAACGPVVASVALVWSRYNGTFAGFGEPLATLTVTHFHFTFGLLPLALAAAVRAGRIAPGPVWGVVFVPPLVGALFALRPSAMVPSIPEALAIVGLTGSIVGVAVGFRDRLPRAGAVLLAVCTSLAAWFSLHLALGRPTLDYAEMLRWHGVGNALGTLLIGLWAFRCAAFDGTRMVEPRPDLDAPTRDVAPERAIFRDHRLIDLGPDAPGRFETITDRLLRYHFYPPHVMRHATTFDGRHARIGDRIGMTLLVDLFVGYAPLALPATTEVFRAERGPDAAALGYLTTARHYGKGAWCASVDRVEGRIRLTLDSRMTPLHPLAVLGLPIYRWYQKRAHRLGAENLARPE